MQLPANAVCKAAFELLHFSRDALPRARTLRALALAWAILAAISIPGRCAVLESAEAVRQLSSEEADQLLPVQIRGVVLYYNSSTNWDLVIHDGSAALYIATSTETPRNLAQGDRVEVTGVTNGGDFAPMVRASELRVIGKGELPPPRERTLDQLASGGEDGQWVKVRGIVRRAEVEAQPDGQRLSLEIVAAGRRVIVRVPKIGKVDPQDYVDAEATITGICFTAFNNRRQLLGIRMRAPDLSFVQVERTALRRVEQMEVQPVNTLLKFEKHDSFGHRVRVHGIVLATQPGRALFIRDKTQALWVRTSQTIPEVSPGDSVDVLGFPVTGVHSPALEDATYHRMPGTHAVSPLAVNVAQAAAGELDGDLVTLEADLLDSAHDSGHRLLVLREGDAVFRAEYASSQESAASALRPGARLRLRGVVVPENEGSSSATGFHLLLRSEDDVEVLHAAPWWTPRSAAVVSLLLVGVVGAAMLWIRMLRARIGVQTEEIGQKAQREAVLEERSRIAREFHDTLEQELAGVILQLQAARLQIDHRGDLTRRLLELAESMLRHTQREARSCIWALRATALDNADLPTALRAVANFARKESPVTINVSVRGEQKTLPSRVENHLLRIGQEAVANAVKHAEANHIQLSLEYAQGTITLVAEDDGKGFDPELAAAAPPGRFGLLGIRERAGKLAGDVKIHSRPGAGTRLEVTVASSSPTVSSNWS